MWAARRKESEAEEIAKVDDEEIPMYFQRPEQLTVGMPAACLYIYIYMPAVPAAKC
eukprot:SAG31_NODE_478_length_15144_cov_15.165769_5_plen_56_part_00